MSNDRISVKVEVPPTNDPVEDIMSAFENALDCIEAWATTELLTEKFFTFRFDRTNRDMLAATITATNKKGD